MALDKKKLIGGLRRLGPLFSVVIFALALVVLHRLLRHFQLGDVLEQLQKIPLTAVQESLLLMVGSYLALGGFDGLAVHYIGRTLAIPRILLTSFVSHAVSQSAGFATLSGGAIRFRLYRSAGLSAVEVAAVVGFCGLTFGLGASSLAALALLTEPQLLAHVLHLPPWLLVIIGGGLVALVGGYLAWGATGRREFTIFGRVFVVPRPRLALGQIAVAATDLALAAAVLWVLLPEAARPGYPAFLGAYVVANLLGLLAHVPGGLGVFDAAILVLTPSAPPDAVLGALLMFRVIYQLIPLSVAAVILLIYELVERLPRFGAGVKGGLDELGPPLLAMLVFVTGALTVLAHAVPEASHVVMSLPERWLGALEASAGALCMGLARGLNQRVRRARLTAFWVVAGLGLVTMVRDPLAPRALSLGLLAVILALSGDLSEQSPRRLPVLSAAWTLAVGAMLSAACWMTWFEAHGERMPAAALVPATMADAAAVLVFLLYLFGLPGFYRVARR